MMTIRLKDRRAERLLRRWVKTGRFRSANEAVATCAALLEWKDQECDAMLNTFEPGELDRLLQVGLDQIERGEVLDGEQALRELDEMRERATRAAARAAQAKARWAAHRAASRRRL